MLYLWLLRRLFVVAQGSNPSTWGTNADGSLRSRLNFPMHQDEFQVSQDHSEALSLPTTSIPHQ